MISEKNWKNTVFKRLFLAFFIIILPLYILAFIINNWGMRTIQNEVTDAMVTQTSFYINSLEMDIKRIQLLQYECLIDEDLNNLAIVPETMDIYEKSRAILRVQQRLNAIKNSSQYIMNCQVYILNSNTIVSANHVDEDDSKEEFESIRKVMSDNNSKILYWQNRMFLSVIYPLKENNVNSQPLFIINIELSREALTKALLQFNKHKGGEVFLTGKQKDFIIAKTQPEIEASLQIISLFKQYGNTGFKSSRLIDYNGEPYLCVSSLSDYLDIAVYEYVPTKDVYEKIRLYRSWFLLFSLLAVIIIVVYSFYTYKFIHKPMQTLVQSFKRLEDGDLDITIQHSYDDEFKYIYNRFNIMVKRLNNLIDQVYRQKMLSQKAELKQLQSQIDPHFLYNSFFILSRMIKGQDIDTAEKFTKQLGNYFRFVTKNVEDEVSLAEELEHVRNYARIQEMRFFKRLRVDFDEIHPGFSNIIVPRLIIQPIIENAFEHGLQNKKSKGILLVSFNETPDEIFINIEDNGEELSDSSLNNLGNMLEVHESNTESTGLINVHRRIQLKFGKESGLILSRSELGGMKITIKLKREGRDCCV